MALLHVGQVSPQTESLVEPSRDYQCCLVGLLRADPGSAGAVGEVSCLGALTEPPTPWEPCGPSGGDSPQLTCECNLNWFRNTLKACSRSTVRDMESLMESRDMPRNVVTIKGCCLLLFRFRHNPIARTCYTELHCCGIVLLMWHRPASCLNSSGPCGP